MLKHLKERRQSEEGFTLIELMVVVLIMGILMAIAIPTFLATQGSAHDAAAKSNATNAFTNEKAYYADNQAFSTSGSSLDDSLPWGTALNDVQVYTDGSTNTNLLIVAGSKSGNCYYIADSEGTSSAYIGYAETTGATTCAAPTTAAAWTGISSVLSTGTAAGASTLNSAGLPAKFYPSF
jgi:type IV pilus assembly protein PilA